MMLLEATGGRFGSWLKRNQAELKLSLRVTTSGAVTLLLSQLLQLRFALWAVLTAVLLTQLNIGRSVKATLNYLAGTLGGAIFAGGVATFIPHDSEPSLVIVLAVALVPVAFVAAKNVRFSAAPFTAVLVLLAPLITHLGPISSASERIVEVAVGCIVGLSVSIFVLPSHAHDLAIESAARLLDLMARALPKLLRGLTRDCGEVQDLQLLQEIDQGYAELEAITMEGSHERMTSLASRPDLGPLSRALHRLRDDYAMIARTAVVPLPGMVQARLGKELRDIGDIGSNYLQASGTALAQRSQQVSRLAMQEVLNRCAADIKTLRTDDTLTLSVNAFERVFTLAFALHQLREHLANFGALRGRASRTTGAIVYEQDLSLSRRQRRERFGRCRQHSHAVRLQSCQLAPGCQASMVCVAPIYDIAICLRQPALLR